MARKERRRTDRIPYVGPVVVWWEDEHGDSNYVRGKCLDVSERGMRIEVPKRIPVRTWVVLRAERINLGGSASVRHVGRSGSHYIVGLEMCQVLKGIPEPQAVPPLVRVG
jgi:hypothetical protein